MTRIAKVIKILLIYIYICINIFILLLKKIMNIFYVIDFNQTHEYNKTYNQIPNKLFAMSQNTNLKKKVHNYGIGK